MKLEDITIEVASEKHLIYVDKILTSIEEAAQVRGTGIARRKPEYIARKMLVNDPCNEEALQYLTKAMLSRNNTKQAHYVYESFCAEYKKTYGEDFKMSFEEVASDIKVGEN